MATQLASAAAGVLPLVTGPALRGSVLGSFTHAVIIGVRAAAGPRVVSLLSARAAGVPTGVRIAGVDAVPHFTPEAAVLVGNGRVQVDGLDVRVVRSWDSRVPAVRPVPARLAALSRSAGRAERGVPDGAVDALREALATPGSGTEQQSDSAGNPTRALDRAIDGLVGLGRGLTPGGDDVIAGLLSTLHAVGVRYVVGRIRSGLRNLADRTTTLSADLLRLAADGHACVEALGVLRLMAIAGSTADDPDPTSGAVHRLLSVGHTSGADLATGMAVGFEFAMSPQGRAALTRFGVAETAAVR